MSTHIGLLAVIEEQRMTRGWTKAKLTREAGISKACYEHWISGRRRPSLREILNVGEVFGLTLEWTWIGGKS